MGARSPTATRSSAAASCRRCRGRTTTLPAFAQTGEVDTVDGFVLALSPWVVRNVRFDESLGAAARLRLRLLPAGARRRAQGRDRGLQGRPPPLARAGQQPRDVARRAHAGGGEVGRPHAGRRPRRRRTGASARGARRRRRRSRAPRRSPRCCTPTREKTRLERELDEVTGSIELAAHRAAAPPERGAQGAPGAMIAFGCAITAPEIYERHAGPGIDAAAEPDSARFAFRATQLDLPPLQPDPRPGRGARRPRGARARAPGHRARRPRVLRQGPRGARRSRRRRRRLHRRARRAQHRLVGGLGHVGVVHPPLRRARRRRPAGLRVGGGRRGRRSRAPARSTSSTASCSCSRRGRCATCASTSRSGSLHGYDVDFCLQARAAGRKVVTADFRASTTTRSSSSATPRAGSRRTCASPRSGTGASRAPRRSTATGRRARAAPRPRPRPRGPPPSRKQLQYDAREREFQRALDEMEREHRLAPHRAAAAGQPLAPARAAALRCRRG